MHECIAIVPIRFPTRYVRFLTGYRVRFCSVLDKTWVLIRFVLAGFGFFPISNPHPSPQNNPYRHCWYSNDVDPHFTDMYQ